MLLPGAGLASTRTFSVAPYEDCTVPCGVISMTVGALGAWQRFDTHAPPPWHATGADHSRQLSASWLPHVLTCDPTHCVCPLPAHSSVQGCAHTPPLQVSPLPQAVTVEESSRQLSPSKLPHVRKPF